jgi:ADP-ribosylglycohydrolase
MVDKVALGQVFSRLLRFSPGAPLLGKGQKISIIFIFILITGLHNKPQGCGASVASAAGHFTAQKNSSSAEQIKARQQHASIKIKGKRETALKITSVRSQSYEEIKNAYASLGVRCTP